MVDIDWTCDFKRNLENIGDCIPTFTFERIDNDGDGIVSEGFNFRTLVYENNSTIRELKKLYGIRIAFTSTGRASMFSFLALSITFGAGIVYLGISKLITDLALGAFMMCHQKNKDPVRYSKFEAAKYARLDDIKNERQSNEKELKTHIQTQLANSANNNET